MTPDDKLKLARAAYGQYMRDTLTSRGTAYDESSIQEAIDGAHDNKHGIGIALAAIEATEARFAEILGRYGALPEYAAICQILKNDLAVGTIKCAPTKIEVSETPKQEPSQ